MEAKKLYLLKTLIMFMNASLLFLFSSIFSYSFPKEVSKVDDKAFLDSIKKRSKFETWGGKTQLPSTRFHHLLSPPAKLTENFRIVSASRNLGYPALDSQTWTLGKGEGDDIICVINLFEYPSINHTHEALIERLASFTEPRLDFNPKSKSPGDVIILSEMVRDNLLLRQRLMKPISEGTRIALLEGIDEWLISNWPLMASKQKSGDAPSLKVIIRTTSSSVRAGDSLNLVIEVRKNDAVLDLKTLPHRFLANPGRISWKNNSYIFTTDRRGMSEITLDIVGPEGEYGQGSLKLQVTTK